MRLSKPLAASVAVLALLLSMLAAPLAAQSTAQDGSDFEVLHVDLSGDTGLVAFRPQQDAETETSLVANIGGDDVAADTTTLANSPISRQTVLIVDNSVTADTVTGYSQIRSAALAYMETVTAGTEVMLILAGDNGQDVRPEIAFTLSLIHI